MNDVTKRSVLGHLSSAFWHTGLEAESKELDVAKGERSEKVAVLLSRLEGRKDVPRPLVELVTAAKAVLAETGDVDEFFVESMKYIGLM